LKTNYITWFIHSITELRQKQTFHAFVTQQTGATTVLELVIQEAGPCVYN